MPKTKTSMLIAPENEKKHILLGEFWVGEDKELWTDPTDPETGFQQAVKFDQIRALQKKLQAKGRTHTATRYSNRRPPG